MLCIYSCMSVTMFHHNFVSFRMQFEKRKIKVGNEQEMAQSESDSHSKNRGGKTKLTISYLYFKLTYRKLSEQLYPNWQLLSYPNFKLNIENLHILFVKSLA